MSKKEFEKFANQEYKFGFKTDVKSNVFAKGLSEDVIRKISKRNKEPDFILEFRLKAYKHWLKMEEPDWALLDYPKIDYQDISYYAEPEKKEKLGSIDDVDPEVKRTFEKLGIPFERLKYGALPKYTSEEELQEILTDLFSIYEDLKIEFIKQYN